MVTRHRGPLGWAANVFVSVRRERLPRGNAAVEGSHRKAAMALRRSSLSAYRIAPKTNATGQATEVVLN